MYHRYSRYNYYIEKEVKERLKHMIKPYNDKITYAFAVGVVAGFVFGFFVGLAFDF